MLIMIFVVNSCILLAQNGGPLREYLDQDLTLVQHVKDFYKAYNFEFAWVNHPDRQQQLLDFIKGSSSLGLKEADYDPAFLDSLLSDKPYLVTSRDSIIADTRVTGMAFHFFTEVAFGNHIPQLGYNGLSYYPGCQDIPYLLAGALRTDQLAGFLQQIEPKTQEYVALKTMLTTYRQGADSMHTPKSGKRIRALINALNTSRWLHCARTQWPLIVVVNIPAAFLFVYDTHGIVFTSEVIVGKRSTRTPVFTTQIKGVILYPYWVVPARIATRELVPLIKKDIRYLDANNLQVMNQQGRVVQPETVQWNKMNASNFPYTLRQSTGCDNSLGIVKFNFYSPYGVYLHDTPWKSLFLLDKRFFSHGCIRVRKAMELARMVLKDNMVAIDTLEEKGCLVNQRPIDVPTTDPLPLFILYNTVWTDSSGTIQFYDDIYNKDS